MTFRLTRKELKRWRRRTQHAYERLTYEEAKRDLGATRTELAEMNQSAEALLDGGFEESLALDRLLGRSIKKTNEAERSLRLGSVPLDETPLYPFLQPLPAATEEGDPMD